MKVGTADVKVERLHFEKLGCERNLREKTAGGVCSLSRYVVFSFLYCLNTLLLLKK